MKEELGAKKRNDAVIMPRYWVIAPCDFDRRKLWERVWQYDLAHNVISIGWADLKDISSLREDELSERLARTYPSQPPSTRTLTRRMLRDFFHSIKVGDVVVARAGRKQIAGIGTVTGSAFYQPDLKAEVSIPEREYAYHLSVTWWPEHRNKTFVAIVFAMQTLYEVSEEKFRSLIDNDSTDAADSAGERSEIIADVSIPTVMTLEPPPDRFRPLTIGSLTAANNAPVFVKRDNHISEAITKMRLNNYSQLPVMANTFNVEGWVSWKSIGLRRGNCMFVRDCIDDHVIVLFYDHALLDAVTTITQEEVVLIKSRETKEIVGLVTITDLVDHYHSRAEPFLLIGEIENYVRQLVSRGNFSRDALSSARDPRASTREITRISNLSLGECVRFLDNPTNWSAIQIDGVTKEPVLDRLHEVVSIRNRVMHFDNELSNEPDQRRDLMMLRNTVKFLESLRAY